MEYRDMYDENKRLTGETFEKNVGVTDGYFYLMVVCFMQNNKGQFNKGHYMMLQDCLKFLNNKNG